MRSRRWIGWVAAAALTLAVVAAACAAPASPSPFPTPSPSPTASPTPSPTVAAPLTRDQAIAAARAAVPQRAKDGVLAAELRRFADAAFERAPSSGPMPEPDSMVWVVNLGSVLGPLNGQGTIVLVDAADGHVIQAVDWIS